MDADERDICEYLKSWQGQFVASKEICRRAGGKWRYREDPNWAVQVLVRLVEKGILEQDAGGHVRLRPRKKTEKKRWVSPAIKKILTESGKPFGDTVAPQELDDFDEQ